jgi:ubiquinone/menaquinone biosynthesis C-methylase UbiE
MSLKFDPRHLGRLNDPARTLYLDIGRMWEGFGVDRPRSVVDLGAGTGFFAVRFAPLLAPGGKIHACDSSPLMVDWMKANLTQDQLACVVPMVVGESAIGLPDGSVDLLYMINVHHELEDPSRLLAEARRALRPGAPLAVIDWKKSETLFNGESHGPPLDRRVDEEAIRTDLEAAGFTVISAFGTLRLHYFFVARQQ